MRKKGIYKYRFPKGTISVDSVTCPDIAILTKNFILIIISKMGCKNSKVLTPKGLFKVIEKDNAVKFISQEYDEIINMKIEGTFNASMSAENQKETDTNRLCYDHSRVVLSEEDGSSNYINASYISGYNHPKAYICTKTPSDLTTGSFWRMVWENKTELIVMLDKHVGNSNLYWSPEEGATLQFGKLKIKTIKVQPPHLNFQITQLAVTHEDGGQLKVSHFLYENWLHNDISPSESDFLNLMFMTRLYYQWRPVEGCPAPHKSPIVVHCSDGLGKAMTFCGIDICLSRFLKTGKVDIFSTFSQLRKERFNCLFDINQYFFCYCVLANYFTNYL